MKKDTNKIYIRTFGCQMNVRDSEVVCGLLKNSGFKITSEPERADVIIFNTCSVRQHAEDKVWSEIGRYKTKDHLLSLKARHLRPKIIGVIGCMAQNYQDKIFDQAANVSFVVGPADIAKIPGILAKLANAKEIFERRIYETEGETRPEEIYFTGFYELKNHGFCVISEGCSNFCSYCVVPYVRGPLRHRSHKKIIEEIKSGIDKGITSFTLLGQNVNSYNDGRIDFIKLLELVNSVKGLKDFGFITSHPKDIPLDLFRAMADLKKLRKYLHLPVQSGSDRILKLMNRGYSKKMYLDLTDNYRKIVKGGALTTDIIVGFPTESETDFRGTYGLVRDIRFNAAYIFKYSSRPNTEAARMSDDVTKLDKERRHRLILELQKEISNKVKSQESKVKSTSKN